MFESDLLAGETATVTGASHGIGAAIARTLAIHGAGVALAARSEDELTNLAGALEADHGVSASVVSTDVRNPKAIAGVADSASDLGTAPSRF